MYILHGSSMVARRTQWLIRSIPDRPILNLMESGPMTTGWTVGQSRGRGLERNRVVRAGANKWIREKSTENLTESARAIERRASARRGELV
jgi:hypothetical protein